jgi:putative ABC transport system permease protein
LISILIASPLACILHNWLQILLTDPDNWWVFVLAGLVAVLITFITVSIQAIKAAMANPVKNLRTE